MRISVAGLLVGSVLSLATACGTGTPVADDVGNMVPGRIGGAYVAADLSTPHGPAGDLRLTLGDGALTFNGGCNTYHGDADWSDGVLSVSGLGGTEMGCPDGGNARDAWLADYFTAEPDIMLSGVDVVLDSGSRQIRFVPYVENGQPVSLVDTTWRLTTVGRYSGDSGGMTDAGSAEAIFRTDGDTFTVQTGVNTISGHVEVSQGRLVLSGVSSTLVGVGGTGSAELGELEAAQQRVFFAPEVTWYLSGHELRLRTPDEPSTELVYQTS